MCFKDLSQESEEISSTVLPSLAVHNLSYIGATNTRREGEGEEGKTEGSPLVEPDTPTESIGGRYLIPDGAPGDAWESDSLDRSESATDPFNLESHLEYCNCLL